MSEPQTLFLLQEVDLRIEGETTALEEVARALGDRTALTSAEERVDQLRGRLREQEQRLRDLEWDVAQINQEIARDERRLYGGRIHAPKELGDIQKDIRQLQTRRGTVEDRAIEALAAVEETQGLLQTAETALGQARSAWDMRHQELIERQGQIQTQLVVLRGERDRLVAALAAPTLTLYERLRREKRGRAVSRIERSTCLGCRISLPTGTINHVRQGRELVFCPSCGRILTL